MSIQTGLLFACYFGKVFINSLVAFFNYLRILMSSAMYISSDVCIISNEIGDDQIKTQNVGKVLLSVIGQYQRYKSGTKNKMKIQAMQSLKCTTDLVVYGLSVDYLHQCVPPYQYE
jgi:hypothetical protein